MSSEWPFLGADTNTHTSRRPIQLLRAGSLHPQTYRGSVALSNALFIEVNELTDKTENPWKIAGDVYAARLFTLVAARLELDQWKGNVRDKLKTSTTFTDSRFTTASASLFR